MLGKLQEKGQTMKNYANPPIPDGYEHICGEWNNGFVIERQSDGSQFVWVPVGSLKGNERKQDAESIKKYGGFYISRFNISKSPKGKPQSIQGEFPWTRISFCSAMRVAKSIERSKYIESHLTHDEEYDCVLKWFINSRAASYEELYIDSINLGNYCNSKKGTHDLEKTGSCEEWCINNIYDFAGNVAEWTDNNKDDIFRGGSFFDIGRDYPASFRDVSHSTSGFSVDIGFRVVLYIK